MKRSGSLTGTMVNIANEHKDDGSGKNRHVDPQRSGKKGRINLKAVAEVLAEHGMDPTVEIIKLLVPTGEDDNGKPARSPLDADVQARIWNELLQYTQPKLKSIEVRAKIAATAFDINDEQAKRIAEEFLKAAVDDEGAAEE